MAYLLEDDFFIPPGFPAFPNYPYYPGWEEGYIINSNFLEIIKHQRENCLNENESIEEN